MKGVVAVLLLAVAIIGCATADIQCSDAVSQVLPCEAFLLTGNSAPSGACCSAIQTLGKIATASREDRKAICECFKDAARSFPINLAKAQQLPQLCHVTVPVSINPNVDCNSI